MKQSELSQRIAAVLIKGSTGTEEAMFIQDLIAAGVEGELLQEVLEILSISGYTYDTTPAPAHEGIVQKNTRECEMLMKTFEDEAVKAEFELLRKEPVFYVGVRYDKNSDRQITADSGEPLNINRYTASSKSLISESYGPRKAMILLDGAVKTYDAENCDHNIMN